MLLSISQFYCQGIVNSCGRRTERQQWLNYHGKSSTARNWIVHIQVVKNNAVNVPFQKLAYVGVREKELDDNFLVMTDLLFRNWDILAHP